MTMYLRVIVVLIVLAVGCSDAPLPAQPAPEIVPIAGPAYDLAPGEERRYLCASATVDRDLQVTRIAPSYGPGVHHLVAWLAAAPEPPGTFDCPLVVKPTWLPLYVAGIASTPLVVPDGAAIQVPKGVQIVIQLHLLNGEAASVSGSAGIEFTVTEEPGLTPAGAWGADNHQIAIPAMSPATAEHVCAIDRPMDVFAAFGHAHRLATKIELERGSETLFHEAWSFDDQPVIPSSFHLDPGDQVVVRCTYFNPTSSPVGYGESTADEMCALVLYYTPWPGFAGCVQP